MAMFGIASIGLANVLVLLRVFILWERRPLILRLMSFGFLSGFTAQFVCMILANIKLSRACIPGLCLGAISKSDNGIPASVTWSPIAKMCVVADHTPLYIAVWVSPMLFESLVILFTVINALDRPRSKHTRITTALHADGVAYFLTLFLLRTLNLALAATGDPSLTLLTVFFVWAMTTTVLNRSLLNIRHAEVTESIPAESGRASPFGMSGRVEPSVQVLAMDELTLYDPERSPGSKKAHEPEAESPEDEGGHRASESVGSNAKLLMLEVYERDKRRGSPDSDWEAQP
ncbi:hypothetical protein EIP91_003689 [Steccherinum ochraceum]|uniref:Uncharacterized protein n=1 Tax=Steccherinum ochraceum TaxID=92696 RepID=A0A4R0RDF2_9APHY|nr:hypothetical protein EIP91_003689 [Steccherinum ochraceum]